MDHTGATTEEQAYTAQGETQPSSTRERAAASTPELPAQPSSIYRADSSALFRARERMLDGLASVIAVVMDTWDLSKDRIGAMGPKAKTAAVASAGACAIIALTAFIGVDGQSGHGSASAMSTYGDAPVPNTLIAPAKWTGDAAATARPENILESPAAMAETAAAPLPTIEQAAWTGTPASEPQPETIEPVVKKAPTPVVAPKTAPKVASVDKIMLPDQTHLADPMVDAEVELAANPEMDMTVTIGNGDTLAKVLDRAGVGARQTHYVVQSMRKTFDPRKLRPGQDITVSYIPPRRPDDRALLTALAFDPEPGLTVTVARQADGGFAADKIKAKQIKSLNRVDGTITSSLYLAALKAGLPSDVLGDMILTYSFDVDFQRDIRPNDTFEVMYESFATEKGKHLKNGNVLYAIMTVGGKPLPLYRFKDAQGFIDYYDNKGRSVRKALLRTPINGARLSSGYGTRRHPILGYNKMHKGVDFAAPRGTPIYAAGNGFVERAGRNGGYGNYVRIKHNNGYSTAYAHMKGIAGGIKKGGRVRQGQVIGYLGSTGRSTGPHLHYEVLRNGKQMNPMSVRLPSGKHLQGKELKTFTALRDRIDTQLAELRNSAKPSTEVASAE